MSKQIIYIITGGTMVHITPHFSVTAPAYGTVGVELYKQLNAQSLSKAYTIYLVKTKMAGVNSDEVTEQLTNFGLKSTIETNDELKSFVEVVSKESRTKAIIMASAICDFQPEALTAYEDDTSIKITEFGKDKKRLHKAHSLELKLEPSKKIVDIIKKINPEIFLVTFKTTAGSTKEVLIEKSRYNLNRSQSNMVFGNDIQNRINLIVTEDEVFSAESRALMLELFVEEFFKKIKE